MNSETRITSGGQVSIPAAIRRRWQTQSISIEDRGDAIVIRPMPSDPIEAALGSLWRPNQPDLAEIRAQDRAEEAEIEERRYS